MKVLSGILRIARFRADGFQAFAATPQALLNSLAPLLAFPIIGGLFDLLHGAVVSALTDLMVAIVALLTPLVITEAFARRWGREALWLRYAVASNWCQWILPVVLVGLTLVLSAVPGLAGGGQQGLIIGAIGLLVAYGVGLHWFLARVGLDLSRKRAALVVLAADVLTGLLVLVPRMMAMSAPTP